MIVYFSGTGNSKYVAERVAAALEDKAVSIEKQGPEITLAEGECFGVVTPTHWWELPVLSREFLEKLELKGATKPYVFLIVTYGTTPGCCGEDARRILQKRGVELTAAFSVKMPAGA